MSDNRVPLTLGLAAYSHVQELRSGDVQLAGIAASFVDKDRPDADVRDIPLIDYIRARSQGDRSFTALPVFLSRAFVHSWIHRGSTVGPVALADETVTIYARGLLRDAGDTSSVIITSPRRLHSAGSLEPIFDRPAEAEREAYGRTLVFPILSVLVVRTSLLERERWLASNIYRAFEVSRRRCFARLEDIRGSRVPIPSVAAHVRRLREVLGAEIWTYGLEPNRPTLETFMRYATQEGLPGSEPPSDIGELFHHVEPFVDFTDGV